MVVPLQAIDRCQNHVLPGNEVRRSGVHRATWLALIVV